MASPVDIVPASAPPGPASAPLVSPNPPARWQFPSHVPRLRPRHPASTATQSAPSHSSAPDERPKRIERIQNLASIATNVMRPREQLHTVRYIAQVDMEDWLVRRSKMGSKTNFFVRLEGNTISVLKNHSAPPRYLVNVRMSAPKVDVPRRELHIYIPSAVPQKERLLRLHISTDDNAKKWKHAIDSVATSYIDDHYTFGKRLGSGAYGEVFEAFSVSTKEKRAVKIISKGNNSKSLQHLESEMQVMKSISHPNIIQTYQIFDLKRTIYIVMEYVSGGDLFDFVAQHDCLTEAQGSQIIRSIFRAVEYLHRQNIVHRDLKPENILCANQSWPLEIKVSDFGFSSFMDQSNNGDNTMRTQVGTPYFMAPEILTNKGHGSPVDSWACGVILYTILTGRLPFSGKNTTEYFQNVLHGQPLFPSVLWKGISPDAMSLVKGLLNPDPIKRLTSLGALQHRWVSSPNSYELNTIRRDRSNLHSRRRRLFKARKAVIAVAMANKFKATIPQVVDKVGDSTKKVVEGIENGVKKTADGVEEGFKKTAQGLKKVGDGIGEGTKKVAEGIGTGVKKTADGIESGIKKTADGIGDGLKKTADGLEQGIKKTADGIETGFKKTGDGLKKTADGIETGFKKTGDNLKKTADGIETGLKKTGDNLKKTADGIETGLKKTGDNLKKTADGIETGFKKTGDGLKKTADGIGDGLKKTGAGIGDGLKKTADGIGEGWKKTTEGIGEGMKKSGASIKKGVEHIKLDKSRDNEGQSNTMEESHTGSTSDIGRKRRLFRRRGHHSRSRSSVLSEPSRSGEVPTPLVGSGENQLALITDSEQPYGEKKISSAEYYSATEEHSETEEGWENSMTRHTNGEDMVNCEESEEVGSDGPGENSMEKESSSDMNGKKEFTKDFSVLSSGSSGNRPKLALLSGLTMGLSDDRMVGGGNRRGGMDCLDSGEICHSDSLRKTAAMLLASNAISEVEVKGEQKGIITPSSVGVTNAK